MSKLDKPHPWQKLWPVLRAHGFDPDTKQGRALLARFAGVSPRKLETFASGEGSIDYNIVVALCEALNAPLVDVLAPQRHDFSLLPVYPFNGGEPLFLSVPRIFCMKVRDESLFYLHTMHDSDFRSGCKPGTWFIGQRRAPLTVGHSYVLSGEAGEEIRRCVDIADDDQIMMSPFLSSRTSLPVMTLRKAPDAPGFLIDARTSPPSEWLVAGLILGTYSPE